MKNEELEQALRFDPLAEAEKITGLSYKESDAVTALGMGLMQTHKEYKDALLLLNRDTRYGLTMDQLLEIFRDLKFVQLLKGDIPDTPDSWYILWRKGILLFCESYFGGKSMNSGNAYFNYVGPHQILDGCSSGFAGEIDGQKVWTASLDIREGFRHRLENMEAQGKILPRWVESPFLWLLHYNEPKVPGYDHHSITNSRISLLPEQVRKDILRG